MKTALVVPTRELTIDLRVRVSDGSFETNLTFPVSASKEQRDGIVEMWLKGIQMAVSGATPAQESAQEEGA